MLQYSLEQTHQCRLLDTAYLILTQVKTSCILNENEYYEVLTGSCKTTKTAASVRSPLNSPRINSHSLRPDVISLCINCNGIPTVFLQVLENVSGRRSFFWSVHWFNLGLFYWSQRGHEEFKCFSGAALSNRPLCNDGYVLYLLCAMW